MKPIVYLIAPMLLCSTTMAQDVEFAAAVRKQIALSNDPSSVVREKARTELREKCETMSSLLMGIPQIVKSDAAERGEYFRLFEEIGEPAVHGLQSAIFEASKQYRQWVGGGRMDPAHEHVILCRSSIHRGELAISRIRKQQKESNPVSDKQNGLSGFFNRVWTIGHSEPRLIRIQFPVHDGIAVITILDRTSNSVELYYFYLDIEANGNEWLLKCTSVDDGGQLTFHLPRAEIRDARRKIAIDVTVGVKPARIAAAIQGSQSLNAVF